jgi:hypothetical protein
VGGGFIRRGSGCEQVEEIVADARPQSVPESPQMFKLAKGAERDERFPFGARKSFDFCIFGHSET